MGIDYESVLVFGVKFELEALRSNPKFQEMVKMEEYDYFHPEHLSRFVEETTSSRLTVEQASPYCNSDYEERSYFINVVEFVTLKKKKMSASALRSFLDSFDHDQFKEDLKLLGLEIGEEPCLMHSSHVW